MRTGWVSLSLCFACAALLAGATGSPQTPAPAGSAALPALKPAALGTAVPLYFIANEGQMSAKALYYARTPGYTLWLTQEGLVFDRIENTTQSEASRSFSAMTFIGANKDIEIGAADLADYKVSFFIGRDEADWKTGIPTSKAVLYKNVYDGIDLKVYGTEKQVEYDWVVAPGADPAEIRFAYSGANAAKLSPDGDLVVETSTGQILQRRPVSHQVIDGRKVAVASAFRTLPDGSFGFSLGAYDPRHALTIDPLVHAYSTYLGGYDSDGKANIALDRTGAVYISGYTLSGDFPPDMGAAPRKDVFLTKLSPDGSSLIFTAFFPSGEYTPRSPGPFVDSKGFAYLCGSTKSTSFPLKNAFQTVNEGWLDGFILKLSRDGQSLVYSSYIGGDATDYCHALAVDASGAAYIGGMTSSKNFPTKRAYRNKLLGYSDAFAAKVAPDGSSLVYSTYLGGSHEEACLGIAVDAQGAAVLVGQTGSPNFPVKAAFQRSLAGSTDVFISKLTPAGNGLIYSSYFGGPSHDEIWDIALDETGAAYLAGNTLGKIPVRNAFQSTRKGMFDGFVAKIASNGRSVVYSSYLGGVSHDYTNAITVDGSGSAYISGDTSSRNFPVKSPYQASLHGSQDAFLTVVDPSGAKLLYSTFLGGIYRDEGWGVVLGAEGAIYLSGETNSPDFPTKDAYQSELAGDYDAFVFKFTVSGSTLPFKEK